MSALVILLAAGKGTRMRSDRPKVLHELAGRPLLAHPLRAAHEAGASKAVMVVGHGASQVTQAARAHAAEGLELSFAEQLEQKGTGHAVLCALPLLEDYQGPVLILSGDVPLLKPRTLLALVAAAAAPGVAMSMLSFEPTDPSGYGRVLRASEGGEVVAIREQRDASPKELALRECNAGVYCVPAVALHHYLPRLEGHNAQGELYLTDLVELIQERGRVEAIKVPALEVAGVNTPEQLAQLERSIGQS